MSEGYSVSNLRITFSPRTDTTCYAETLVITWFYRAQKIAVFKVYILKESFENFCKHTPKLLHSDESGKYLTQIHHGSLFFVAATVF
jgi:hypothetical protein